MEGRGEVVLVGDEEVVLLAVLVVRELNGCSRHLGLRGFDALPHVVKGYLEHLPFGGGGDGVPEGGERTHVRRWGGKGEGDRGAGALVPGAVKSGTSGRAEEKWGRGRDRRRIRSGSGWGRVGGAAEVAMVFLVGKVMFFVVRLWLARGDEGGVGDSRGVCKFGTRSGGQRLFLYTSSSLDTLIWAGKPSVS